jgi:D-alanine-D-alanine ligase
MGGISPEREVSLDSGKGVAEALKTLGYEVLEVDYHPESFVRVLTLQPDICFNVLHGGAGEDGTIQGFLEAVGIPYTGPGVRQCAICMDKSLLQPLLRAWGLPVPDHVISSVGETVDSVINRMQNAGFALPVIVKPAAGGSTVGMRKVHERDELLPALEEAWRYDRKALVERLLEGPEITVSVIGGGGDYRCLPSLEIRTRSGFYDYEAKYTPGGSEHLIPPVSVPPSAVAEAERLVLETSSRLELQGVTRTDVMFDAPFNPYLIDVNTSPGMTSLSLVPDAARAEGLEYLQLVEEILRLGLARFGKLNDVT